MGDFTKLKNKTILITGASGLIGLHLLESLKDIKKEYNITIYTWNKTANPEFDYLFEDCIRILSDITEYDGFEELPMFDYIIHSSGYGQPGKFLSDKIKTIKINTSSTIKLLDKLKNDGTFLYLNMTSPKMKSVQLIHNILEPHILKVKDVVKQFVISIEKKVRT